MCPFGSRNPLNPSFKQHVTPLEPRAPLDPVLHPNFAPSEDVGGTIRPPHGIQSLRMEHHEAYRLGSVEMPLRWTPIPPHLEFHASVFLPDDQNPRRPFTRA